MKQLFLLHHAGGNVYTYNPLLKKLKDQFIVEPLELPGRGKRFQENLIKEKAEAIKDLLVQIKRRRNHESEYLIYGHSMGALLGYSLTKQLEVLGDPPSYLFVTGSAGPNISNYDKEILKLPKREFFEKLNKLGGLNDEFLNNPELLDLYEPIIRADFAIVESHFNEISERIQTPIYGFMGSEELRVKEIDNWKNYTTESFQYEILEGNHFFIYNHFNHIASTINDIIR